jgi:hypothetical protein
VGAVFLDHAAQLLFLGGIAGSDHGELGNIDGAAQTGLGAAVHDGFEGGFGGGSPLAANPAAAESEAVFGEFGEGVAARRS